jgi:hypothetical protein
MNKLLSSIAAGVAALIVSLSGHATIVGYYLSGASGNPSAAITANGFTPLALTGLSAAELDGIDVLWILNGSNGAPDSEVMDNVASVTAFVEAGHVLSFHDRNVNQGTSAARYVPGAAGVTFVNEFGTNIDVLDSGVVVTSGPHGEINDTNLDGGNFSNHGYATLDSLPAGALAILSTGVATEIVDFFFPLGDGGVYYSTIPLDFYLSGAGNNPPADIFRNIYASNEALFQATAVNEAPEPGSLALLGIALFGVAVSAGRRLTRNA